MLVPTSTPGVARDGELSFPIEIPTSSTACYRRAGFPSELQISRNKHPQEESNMRYRDTVLMSKLPQKVAMPRDGDPRQAIVSF